MVLTQERAEARSAVIRQGSVFYDFHICLEVGEVYHGFSEIAFDLLSIPKELCLDFASQCILKIQMNGEIIKCENTPGFIYLDVNKLKLNNNKIAILYKNKYDNDGNGCVTFTDVDSKQYIYTQFEAYFANRVFPSFDQPDIKAKMKLNVIAPSTWKKVLSNEHAFMEGQYELEKYVEGVQSHHMELLRQYLLEKFDGKMYLFPSTKILPTYLMCFIAGQYEELKLPEAQRYNNIPMYLYSIDSLYKVMEKMAPFIFEVTIECMRFYQKFFDYKFAFNQYDQVFVHQFCCGAMENAGIVTFNDKLLSKEKITNQAKLKFANTISHEMSHHWFGNLVTMKWWDDLWLNESFADFISHFCLQKIKPNLTTIKFESVMATYLMEKEDGYLEDQMVTTHPIRSIVSNTDVAQSIFDAITYEKGGATMKQLMYLITEDNFSKAVSSYFKKYQWQNATIDEFLIEMQNHFQNKDFTLKEWRSQWLQKSSLNVLQVQWNPEDKSENCQLVIRQTPYTELYPTLRFHKIKIGLYRFDGTVDVLEVMVHPQSETVTFYNGSNDYKAILLNFEDHSFVKIVIDPISLEYFTKNMDKIQDLLSRIIIWSTFFDMVKDAEMTSDQYLQVIINLLAGESEDNIFEKQLELIHTSINVYTPKCLRSDLNSKMFQFVLNLLKKDLDADSNRVVILKKYLLQFSTTDKEIQFLLSWRNKTQQSMKAFQMSIMQKWQTIAKAFTLSNLTKIQKQELFKEQAELDSSTTKINYRYLYDGLIAEKDQFQSMYQSFHEQNLLVSSDNKIFLARGWNHSIHAVWLKQYTERYFDDIVILSEVLHGAHFDVFFENLAPIDENFQYNIKRYLEVEEKLKLKEVPSDKVLIYIRKKVESLKKISKAYDLYQKKINL